MEFLGNENFLYGFFHLSPIKPTCFNFMIIAYLSNLWNNSSHNAALLIQTGLGFSAIGYVWMRHFRDPEVMFFYGILFHTQKQVVFQNLDVVASYFKPFLIPLLLKK